MNEPPLWRLINFIEMPFISAWFHYVWSTKNRKPFLRKEIRQNVFDHIKENARKKDIFIDCVNGYEDHVHCLVSLSSDQTISKIAQLIKGESSFWINKEKLVWQQHFDWQEEYFAVSVSLSQLQNIRSYIHNQESHHQNISYQQEYDEFIKKYGFNKLGTNRS